MGKKLKEKEPLQTIIRSYYRLSMKQRSVFFKHFAAMIQAGVPLEKGLKAIHSQTKSKILHIVIHNLLKDLAAGEDLSSSLKKMNHIFDTLAINLVTVGERTGTLGESLERISVYYEKSIVLRGKILGTLLYPIIVIGGTIATVVYLVFVLLPQILPLFSALNVELPLTTRIVIGVSGFVTVYGLHVIAGFIVLLGIFMLLNMLDGFKYIVHSILLRIPIMNMLIKKTQMARLAYMLGILLGAGVSVVQSFTIASESLDNLVYKKALKTIASNLQDGENISSFLNENGHLFSLFATQMIIVGEETGNLSDSFVQVSSFSEKELDDAVKIMTTLLEPTLMILIGALVGFVALAVIMPIYELTSGIGA